jgi:hypothetical protein
MLDEQKLIASLPDDIQEFIAEQYAHSQQRVLERIKADPVKHKKTLLFDGPMRWRYWSAKDGRGREVRFCYTTTRNAAGYFLGFREVINKDRTGKRDDFFAHRRKKTVSDRALKLFKAMSA